MRGCSCFVTEKDIYSVDASCCQCCHCLLRIVCSADAQSSDSRSYCWLWSCVSAVVRHNIRTTPQPLKAAPLEQCERRAHLRTERTALAVVASKGTHACPHTTAKTGPNASKWRRRTDGRDIARCVVCSWRGVLLMSRVIKTQERGPSRLLSGSLLSSKRHFLNGISSDSQVLSSDVVLSS